MKRVFYTLQLIFIKSRGTLLNPFTLAMTDLLNKYSGSKPLQNAMNSCGVSYSYDTYRRIRAKMINQEVEIGGDFPFPKFDPSIFHFLTIGELLFLYVNYKVILFNEFDLYLLVLQLPQYICVIPLFLDNYDANMPSSNLPGFHTLGSLHNTPNKVDLILCFHFSNDYFNLSSSNLINLYVIQFQH